MATHRTGGPNPAKTNATFKAGGEVRKQPTAAEQRAHQELKRRTEAARAHDVAQAALRAARVRTLLPLDALDTSRGIEAEGTVGGRGEEGVGIPFSSTLRDDRQLGDKHNAAAAVYRDVEGVHRVSNATPLLYDESGIPRMRGNMLERLDPGSGAQEARDNRQVQAAKDYAKRKFAQLATDEVRLTGKHKLERRYITYTLTLDGVKAGQIAQQLGVAEAQVYNYLSDARHMVVAFVAAFWDREAEMGQGA